MLSSKQNEKKHLNPSQKEILEASLFPPWLNNEIQKVQTSPSNWTYNGYLPWGNWQHD